MVFFSDSSAEELTALDECRSVFEFRDNRRIPMSANGTPGFYYLHKGYTKLVFKRKDQTSSQTIRVIGPDDLAGLARWQTPNGVYSMTTLSSVTASFFSKDRFLALAYRSPYLANEAIRWLTMVLSNQEDRLYCIGHRSAKARVAGALHNLRSRFGNSIGGFDVDSSVPVDRKTIADLAGVVIEVLSRTLNDLEEESIIHRTGRIIQILDPKALEQTAFM